MARAASKAKTKTVAKEKSPELIVRDYTSETDTPCSNLHELIDALDSHIGAGRQMRWRKSGDTYELTVR